MRGARFSVSLVPFSDCLVGLVSISVTKWEFAAYCDPKLKGALSDAAWLALACSNSWAVVNYANLLPKVGANSDRAGL